jgi:hypothetical protein
MNRGARSRLFLLLSWKVRPGPLFEDGTRVTLAGEGIWVTLAGKVATLLAVIWMVPA